MMVVSTCACLLQEALALCGAPMCNPLLLPSPSLPPLLPAQCVAPWRRTRCLTTWRPCSQPSGATWRTTAFPLRRKRSPARGVPRRYGLLSNRGAPPPLSLRSTSCCPQARAWSSGQGSEGARVMNEEGVTCLYVLRACGCFRLGRPGDRTRRTTASPRSLRRGGAPAPGPTTPSPTRARAVWGSGESCRQVRWVCAHPWLCTPPSLTPTLYIAHSSPPHPSPGLLTCLDCAALLSDEALANAQTVEELEQEVMLRDTFELFDVEQRGGLDLELFTLLMQQVGGCACPCVCMSACVHVICVCMSACVHVLCVCMSACVHVLVCACALFVHVCPYVSMANAPVCMSECRHVSLCAWPPACTWECSSPVRMRACAVFPSSGVVEPTGCTCTT